MLTIQIPGGEKHHLPDIKEVIRTRRVNGEKTLEFPAIPTENNAHAFELLDTEVRTTFQGEPYIIKNSQEKDAGDKTVKRTEAVHTFFDNMINSFQYGQWSGSQTFQLAAERVFAPTPYDFVIIGTFGAQSFENFGRDNSLSLLKNILDRYGAEFRIVGNTVYLQQEIGARTGFQMRWKHNIKAIDKQTETESFATIIKGFGGTPDNNGVYPIQREYRASEELIAIHGLKHAPAIYDERLSTVAGMDAALRKRLIDAPQLSITVDIAEVDGEIKNEGDYGYIIYGPMKIKYEARVVEIKEIFRFINRKWKIVGTAVTLSNLRNKLTDTTTRFADTSKRVDRLFNGQDKLPFSALDEAVANATKALQNAQTELEFNNGLIARDKTDSNKIVLLNSAGLGVSKDGGQTFGEAITGDGINASYLAFGTARGINLEAVEIYGSLFESRENVNGFENYVRITNNTVLSRGRYNRTWAGESENVEAELGINRGQLMFRNFNSNYRLYMTERGLSTSMSGAIDEFTSGTLEFHSQRFNENSRGVTLHSSWGAVALVSDFSTIVTRSNLTNNIESNEFSVYIRPYRLSRPGTNEFRFWVKDGPTGDDTDGVLSYGRFDGTRGAGIRFGKGANRDIIYITNNNGDIGTGDIRANRFIGDLAPAASYAYVRAERLRVVQAGTDNTNYAELQFSDALCNSIRYHGTGDMYIGVSSNELRVTNNLRWNSGSPGYRPVRASEFINASSIDYKTDISKWNGDALSILTNEAIIYQYKLIDDAETDNNLYRRGLIIEKETPAEFIFGKGVNQNEIWAFIIRGLQQHVEETRRESKELKIRIEELESA